MIEDVAPSDPLLGSTVPGSDDPTPSEGIQRVARSARHRRYFWLKRTVFVVLALCVAGVAYFGITLWQVWSTGHHDQAREVDAIVVMGAANYDGRPSPLLKARLDHALDLYEEGLAPVVIVTGGKLDGDRFTEAEASRRYLVDHGVPDDAILAEDEGGSTWESLESVAGLAEDEDIERVLIVTDPFHSLRSRLIAQELGLTAYTSPTQTSPWGDGTQFKKSLKEAAGISVGRIIGFHRLWNVTG